MYNYYAKSKIRFAYLDDWNAEPTWDNLPRWSASHMSLRWFTRGWTLQELIAPAEVRFFDRKWDLRGHKTDPAVADSISAVTGIAVSILQDGTERSLRSVAVARRMSWAAMRQTMRAEDKAYCLLGIFQINMPLLYSEEGRAFLRLQEEIVRNSTDLSIFAWGAPMRIY